MLVLAHREIRHRIFGFAAATPGTGPLLEDTVRLDTAVHNHALEYGPELMERLMDWCAGCGAAFAEAFVAAADTIKLSWFETLGFSMAACVPEALRLADTGEDLLLLRKKL